MNKKYYVVSAILNHSWNYLQYHIVKLILASSKNEATGILIDNIQNNKKYDNYHITGKIACIEVPEIPKKESK